MVKSIIDQIKTKYDANIVNKSLFFKVNDYCITMYYTNESLICSVSLPTLSLNPALLNDLLISLEYECEYNSPNFSILFKSLADDLTFESVDKVLNSLITILTDNGIKPNCCIRCLNETQDYYNVNGYYSAIDKDCANMYIKENSSTPKVNKAQRTKCFFVSIAFCFIGSLLYIPLGILGIMPALAGILMGILSSLGYKFFSVQTKRSDKVVLFIASLVFAFISNTVADFLYASTQNVSLDFVATYSDPLNLFNTIFDIVAGAIISISSMSIVLDLDRSLNSCSIKRIPLKKHCDSDNTNGDTVDSNIADSNIADSENIDSDIAK